MSAEAIPDAVQEYMYDKLNDSPETEKEKKFHNLKKPKKQAIEKSASNL